MTVIGVPLPPPPPSRPCHPSLHRPSTSNATHTDSSQSAAESPAAAAFFPTFVIRSVSYLPPHSFAAVTIRAFVHIIFGDALPMCLPIVVSVARVAYKCRLLSLFPYPHHYVHEIIMPPAPLRP